jgi:hypothetical protein
MITGVDLAVFVPENNDAFQGFISILPDVDLDAGSRLEFSVRMTSGEGEEFIRSDACGRRCGW